MTSPELRAHIIDNNIVVTLPGYSYAVTYYKPQGAAGLLMKYSVIQDDLRLRMTAAEFLSKAWKLANKRARELRWIA